ncbi:PREDICTED: uncharacterized protein LOC105366001 [Ceratosolen solmsi marchali]|uniref:Uncharacterized protein LOC105366001 n=1 Tax=Ceratosolen solmsi marchali TaxID=326594 RepID=A0AAJ7DZY9_9HYME|nr:PREDICTED: uncharacterized protein LOC105366001 [Ceratosolen solmsi marchali]
MDMHTNSRMTCKNGELRYYATLVIWFVLANFRVCHINAQDASINEVIPLLRGITTASMASSTPERLIACPSNRPSTLTRLLGIICERHSDCQFLGSDQRCCRGICRRGVEAPIYEPPHGDILGIQRKCPSFTFPERLPIQRCSKDADCEGLNRICCPDKSDRNLYCRIAAPIWSELPLPNNLSSLKSLVGYVQCQPAPPAVLDVFTHPCNTTIDCFPNLCCQEGSKKICRPPKRSILTLAIQATSRLIKG